MHYIYVDSKEYYLFERPKGTLIPLSILGIEALRFMKLSDAVEYQRCNQGNFTFIADDDPRVTEYWSVINDWRKQTEDDADRYRALSVRRA